MKRYRYKYQYSWTPNLAYIAGLIASDGCLVNNGRHINITSKDKEIINSFQRILGLKVKVAIKRSGYNSLAYHLQFSNVVLYDFLLAAGIKSAKSKTIESVTLPDSMYADFLRGYFDGDGSIYGFWDKRWKNSLMYYTEYASASLIFLQWMQLKSMRLVGVSRARIKPSVGVRALSYAKADSQKLFDFMYYSAGIPCLSRKKNKFTNFISIDPYAIIFPYARVAESVDAPD